MKNTVYTPDGIENRGKAWFPEGVRLLHYNPRHIKHWALLEYHGCKISVGPSVKGNEMEPGVPSQMEFRWPDTFPDVYRNNSQIKASCNVSDSLAGVAEDSVWFLKQAINRLLFKDFMDKMDGDLREATRSGVKMDNDPHRNSSTVGFVVKHETPKYILNSRVVLGYDFRRRLFIGRCDDAPDIFDAHKWHYASFPIINAFKRAFRGEDPWENPWALEDDEDYGDAMPF